MPDESNNCNHQVPDGHPTGVAWRCPDCGAQVVRIGQAIEHDEARPVILRPEDAWHAHIASTPTLTQHTVLTHPATVPAIVRTLVFMEPTDEHGSYTVMAYDGQDRLLATTEEPSLDDALLAIADYRLWEQDGN